VATARGGAVSPRRPGPLPPRCAAPSCLPPLGGCALWRSREEARFRGGFALAERPDRLAIHLDVGDEENFLILLLDYLRTLS
jgi:hypothetical protein